MKKLGISDCSECFLQSMETNYDIIGYFAKKGIKISECLSKLLTYLDKSKWKVFEKEDITSVPCDEDDYFYDEVIKMIKEKEWYNLE